MVVTVAPDHHLILLRRDKNGFYNIKIIIKGLDYLNSVMLPEFIQVKTYQLIVIQIHGGEGEFVVGGGRSGCGRGGGAAMKFVHRS